MKEKGAQNFFVNNNILYWHSQSIKENTSVDLYDLQGKLIRHWSGLSNIPYINLNAHLNARSIYFLAIREGKKIILVYL